jgi:cytochrome b
MTIIATDGQGPLASTFVSSWSGDFLEEVHEFFVHIALLLILLHIAGVIISSLLQEENLIKAMITGEKKNPKLPEEIEKKRDR